MNKEDEKILKENGAYSLGYVACSRDDLITSCPFDSKDIKRAGKEVVLGIKKH